MSKYKRDGYKRHSIGIVINDEEASMMKDQLKILKTKTDYTRNDVLKIVLTKFLSSDEFIKYCEIKGGLSK